MVNFKNLNLIFLIIICTVSALLVLPTINNNINEPNMVHYLNADEGILMDLVWFYYSGIKRASYYLDIDYGLEMIYLSDIARLFLSRFVNFTPGVFVLILRWLHLISWIGALVALWCLMGRHFQKGWQQVLAVALLAARPAFAYFSNNLKPEPLVLLIMIVGFDFILRFIDKPCRKYLLITTLCAATAFLIKFAGVFLLPAIIAAMFFGQKYQAGLNKNYAPVFHKIELSWLLELLIGLGLIMLPVSYIFLYVRKSAGLTFYREFGFWQSLLNNKAAFFILFMGLIFIFAAFLILIFTKYKPSLKKVMAKINEINSYSFVVFGLFLGFLILFGFRWAFNRANFLSTYSYNLFDFIGLIAMRRNPGSGFFEVYLNAVRQKIASFDMIILLLFAFYLFSELYFKAQRSAANKLQFYKRQTLVIMLIPIFISILSMGRLAQHHVLPFFTVMCILSIQAFGMFTASFKGLRFLKITALLFISILFAADVSVNAAQMIKARIYQFRQKEDVAFDIARWWRENVPLDTKIVADHYIRVYIPSGYRNIRTLDANDKDRVESLKQLVETYRPELVYYNEGLDADVGKAMPELDEILPDKRIKLIKHFKNTPGRYQRRPGAKFAVYRIKY